MKNRNLTRLLGIIGVLFFLHSAYATPQFARMTQNSCIKCHSSVPKLNLTGENFRARGYKAPDLVGKGEKKTIPLAVWLTTRYEDKIENNVEDFFLPKVELISGGKIGNTPLSYFVESRVVSESLNSDGSHKSRSGRFEDLFVQWTIDDQWAFKVGQFRALNQVDVSLRLSPSEPTLFKNSLPGDQTADSRIQGLRSFSPTGRSPSIALQYQALKGKTASEGLFLGLTVPFPGEFSIPLNDEAKDTASFEFEGSPKGVFLETYYKTGMSLIGGHAFVDDDRWLATALGSYNTGDWYVTAGIGGDDTESSEARMRYSLEVEYVPRWWDKIRPGVGMRVEKVTNSRSEAAYIPYFTISGPNQKYSFFLQIQYRAQDNNDLFVIDFGRVTQTGPLRELVWRG